MKKKYILLLTAVVIIIFITLILINNKHKIFSNTTKIDDKLTTDINNEQTNIDWSNYKTYELNLTESKTITEEGIYYITGTIDNGSLTINTDGYIKLILDNVSINNNNGPAINIENAKATYIELKNKNTLVDGEKSENDGAIFSKDDLIIEGDGILNITANNQDGIVSKDNLILNGGNITINSKDDGIRGKDSVVINDCNLKINSEGDGIKSTNDQDGEKGYILINNGNIDINSKLDGIQATTKLVIHDGNINIKTTKTDNQESEKGLKADILIEINGGTFNINTTDDAIHTNGNITINGGNFTLTSKDDAIHANCMIEINKGIFEITADEGIEATNIKINDGNININASDDGINAIQKSKEYETVVEINGGNIIITMGNGDTDGVDSNGDIIINGGTINVTGNSTFDYDGEGTINGGTVICNGEKVTTLPNQIMGGSNMRNQGFTPENSNMNRMRQKGRSMQ